MSKISEQTFITEDVQTANKHEIFSISLVISKMQNKTIRRYHFTPTIMVITF